MTFTFSFRRLFRVSYLFLFFCCLSAVRSGVAQEIGSIPNGSFEDTSAFGRYWHLSYGKPSLEDSIALKGDHSMMIEEVEDHIDLVSDPISVGQSGSYEFSFWYRAIEGSEEWAPLWVELLQDGEAVEVFRIGKEEARMRKLSRDWILFKGSLTLRSGSPVRIFIHSDLPRIWIEDVKLLRDDGI